MFREFHEVFSCSYGEISGIDPSSIKNEIKTYLEDKPVGKKNWHVHPYKATTIKEEVKKLHKVGFIYLVP